MKRDAKKASKATARRRYLPVTLTKRAALIPVFIVVTLFFAQSLRMSVSYMIFIFALIFPVIPAFQLVCARLFLRTSVRVSSDMVEKNTEFSFTSLISNNSVLPFPFIEAELLVPDGRGARCVGVKKLLTLAPLDGCEIKRTAEFAFRGEYEVGLSRIFVYDCFRMARLSIDCEHMARVMVLPRRFELTAKNAASESDITTRTVLRTKGSDNTESSDVRGYLAGDSLKSIHWKLSSKSEKLIVRDYSHNVGDSVQIICDLEPHFLAGNAPDAPLPELSDVIDNLCSDLIVEHSLAAALRELRAGNSVRLLWFSEREGQLIPKIADIYDMNDFESAYRSFAVAPMVRAERQISRLASLCADANGSSLIIVTACIGDRETAELSSLASLCADAGRAVELIYTADRSFFEPDADRVEREQKRLAALSRLMTVTRGSAKGGVSD